MSTTLTTWVNRLSNEQVLVNARESVRKVWLCALGAYSLAVKSGAGTFDNLVREGTAFRPKASRQLAEKSAELKTSAAETLQRGEKLLRERVFRPLDFLVVASKRDVNQLSQRLVELADEVHRLAPEAAGRRVGPSL